MARCLAILLFTVIFPGMLHGESLVLVHGYLGSGADWRVSGVAAKLVQSGWVDGGSLGRRSNRVSGQARGDGARFYTVDLPSEAPLEVQARVLAGFIERLRARHKGEGLILVGHSAGGIVARFTMVRHPEFEVQALITIAAPHLGTDRAELGLMAGQSPLALFAPFIGGQTLNRSQALYADLVRERPGSLLYWLNRQPHPEAIYISVVRRGDVTGFGDDLVVPAWSQDMNNVWALRDQSRTVIVSEAHGLSAADGRWLVKLLIVLHRA